MMKELRDKSVLIVDDDPGMLRALDKVLSREGAVVACAACAADAVEILTGRKKRIDLVITDLRMPFVTGITVLYAIHEIFPALPVIVLTAFGSADVKAECLRQGAAAFLEKPLDTPQLLTAITGVFMSQHPALACAGDRRSEGATSRLAMAVSLEPGKHGKRLLVDGWRCEVPDQKTERARTINIPKQTDFNVIFRRF
jgi:DNA-binding NtrC family response regulator